MKTYTVAVLGATGAVGREMLRVLEERDFPVSTLLPLASAQSAGKTVTFRGQTLTVEAASPAAFAGVDIVLGAAEAPIAREFAPAIMERGAVFVDNSSAFRLDADVPLVIPEVNGEDVARHKGILSNPNCTTAITLTAIHGLRALSPIRSLVASSYQAVSGAGAAGPVELLEQTRALAAGQSVTPVTFSHQIAYNVIPHIGKLQEWGYTTEELKLHYEGRKILHDPQFKAACTCVRVPVIRCHSVSVRITFQRPVSVSQARDAIAAAPGCVLVDEPALGRYPMPLDASDQDLVHVGRIRADITDPNSLHLWCCGDQLRKGAATNAVQIAEEWVRRCGQG